MFKKTLWAMGLGCVMLAAALHAEDGKRSIRAKAPVAYPELAKRMNVIGSVKIEVVVAANGSVRSAKAIGGHPLLVDAALNAAKQFKYEASGAESTEMLTFNFDPNK